MPLPVSHPDRLKNSPLVSVVCQIRFESHPEVRQSNFIKEFHSALGGSKGAYPRIDQATLVEVNVTESGIERTEQAGWLLRDPGERWNINIGESSASIETSAYQDWADFFVRLRTLVSVVESVIAPATERRLGLRYIDRLFDPQVLAPAEWSGRLREELVGVLRHEVLGPVVQASEQKLVLALEDDHFCLLRHGLQPAEQGGAYVLDFDVYRESKSAFDSADLLVAVEKLHDKARSLFQQCLVPDYWDQLRTGSCGEVK